MRAAANVLRLVTLTEEEEAAIERPSPSDETRARSNFATWKFTLMETVAADPLASPFCLSVVTAYLRFGNSETRTAYLSENDLRVRTALNPPTIRKAKQRLVKLGYMAPISKTSAGIVVYRIANPRQELVADHMVFAAEALRELEAAKKDAERRRKQRRGAGLEPPRNAKGGQDSTPTGGAGFDPQFRGTTRR